jgi:hypothetical protein
MHWLAVFHGASVRICNLALLSYVWEILQTNIIVVFHFWNKYVGLEVDQPLRLPLLQKTGINNLNGLHFCLHMTAGLSSLLCCVYPTNRTSSSSQYVPIYEHKIYIWVWVCNNLTVISAQFLVLELWTTNIIQLPAVQCTVERVSNFLH